MRHRRREGIEPEQGFPRPNVRVLDEGEHDESDPSSSVGLPAPLGKTALNPYFSPNPKAVEEIRLKEEKRDEHDDAWMAYYIAKGQQARAVAEQAQEEIS